jgi:hypothetical protein
MRDAYTRAETGADAMSLEKCGLYRGMVMDKTRKSFENWWAVGDLGCSSDLDAHKT